jgi:hypothetical protein
MNRIIHNLKTKGGVAVTGKPSNGLTDGKERRAFG